MAMRGWNWRWGWGRQCPGRSGLTGPGPGPITLLFLLLLLLGLVAADITDGNSEHLKREHSLIKPYQGEARGGNECGERARLYRVEKGSSLSPVGFLPMAVPVLAWPLTLLSVPVSAHRGRFQLHAPLGLPRQHYTHEPVRASDP